MEETKCSGFLDDSASEAVTCHQKKNFVEVSLQFLCEKYILL
jgi:hypothetical protein